MFQGKKKQQQQQKVVASDAKPSVIVKATRQALPFRVPTTTKIMNKYLSYKCTKYSKRQKNKQTNKQTNKTKQNKNC